jgi:hypothetical protein
VRRDRHAQLHDLLVRPLAARIVERKVVGGREEIRHRVDRHQVPPPATGCRRLAGRHPLPLQFLAQHRRGPGDAEHLKDRVPCSGDTKADLTGDRMRLDPHERVHGGTVEQPDGRHIGHDLFAAVYRLGEDAAHCRGYGQVDHADEPHRLHRFVAADGYLSLAADRRDPDGGGAGRGEGGYGWVVGHRCSRNEVGNFLNGGFRWSEQQTDHDALSRACHKITRATLPHADQCVDAVMKPEVCCCIRVG